MSLDDKRKAIDDLILDISLVSAYPIGLHGRNFIYATAAANALASLTSQLEPRELRELEYTIGPLLTLLSADINNSVAAKAAYGIRALMTSRVCMSRLIEQKGLLKISKVFNYILGNDLLGIYSPMHRSICLQLSICYREISRFYPYLITDVGGLRHIVLVLRHGDIELKTVASTTLSSLSNDVEICKQMFINGAIKPLLNACDIDKTNEACVLAGLGCLVQLCRIPEIAVRIVQQGAISVLEKGLHISTGYSVKSIREKSLYSLAWLSRVNEVKSKICTLFVLKGMRRELKSGTLPSRFTVIQMLLNLHGNYLAEERYIASLKELIMNLLGIGPWHARNLCIKAFCVLFRDNESKLWFVENGLVERIYEVIEAKNQDLQEAPLVAFLSLCSYSPIPKLLLAKDILTVLIKFLPSTNKIIRELAIILLKTFYLYNAKLIEDSLPLEHKTVLDVEEDLPMYYGSEYGGMVQEYLQKIVENRRDDKYLLDILKKKDIEMLQLTNEELESYQNTFMEIDLKCNGRLGLDESFKDFVVMMKGWKTRFGTGVERVYNVATKRGAIGRARREFRKWNERAAREAEQIKEAKANRLLEKQTINELTLQYREHERIKAAREAEIELREQLGIPKRYENIEPI